MSQAPVYILDTGILVVLIRAGKLGRYVEETYQLVSQPFKPLISVVSVGEALKLGRCFTWGEKKMAALEHLLNNLVWIDINRPEIMEAYAKIAHFTEQNIGRKSQNDYWIAATAKVTGATLLTTDKDFDHLHEKFINRIYIDETLGKP